MAFAISTVFKAFDKVSPSFKKMTRNAKIFGIGAEVAFRKANKGSRLFRNITSGILAANVIRSGFMRAAQGIRIATEEFINFDHQVTSAAVKFPQVAEQIGKVPLRSLKTFKELQTVAREVGASTKFTAGEAAEGLNFLAMAGFNAAQSIALLPKTTELAVATNVELARATDIATDTLGAFGLTTKNTTKLTENLAMVNDVLAKTVITANTDMEQLFETIRFAGPVAKAAGVSIQEFSAAAGLLANAGIKGSIAGTTLKNAFLRLAGPVGKAKVLMKRLKIVTQDARGDFLPFADILDNVKRATKNMGTAQRSAALDVIFGKRAIAGINVLLSNGSKRLKEYTRDLFESKRTAAEMAAEINKSLKNRLLQLKSALIEVGFKIFEAFAGEGPEAIDRLIEKVRKFDVTPIVDGLKQVIRFLKMLSDNTETIKKVVKTLIEVWASWKIGAAIASMIRFATATKEAAIAAGLLQKVGGGKAAAAAKAAKGAAPAAAVAPGVAAKGGLLPGIKAALGPLASQFVRFAGFGAVASTLVLQGDEGVKNEKLSRAEINAGLEKIGEAIVESRKRGDTKTVQQLEQLQKGSIAELQKMNVSLQRVGQDIKTKGQIRLIKDELQKATPKIINLEEARQRKEIEEARKFLTAGAVQKKQLTAETKERKGTGFAELVQFPGAVAPNKAKEEAAAQRAEFTANINIANAPEGTTVETEVRGAPEVRTNMAGAR